ncbi:MAG: hypothetical protein J0G33_02705 [Afipia felis]|nr:hypothetical protein [Afipia felis]
MAYPNIHTLNTLHLTTNSPSVGTSPVVAYVRGPFRGKILKFTGVLRGAITTADGTITVAVNGTTVGTIAVPQSGSAAGQLFVGSPTTNALAQVNEDDVISFTPSGASGSSIGMDFSVVVRQV